MIRQTSAALLARHPARRDPLRAFSRIALMPRSAIVHRSAMTTHHRAG